MDYKPGSLSRSMFNTGRFYYCGLKEAVDVEHDQSRAQMFLNLIRRDYKTKEQRRLLQALLTKEQWKDLKRLVEIIKTGITESSFLWAEKLDVVTTSKKRLPLKERKMAQMILKNREPLKKALGVQKLEDVKPEDDYGEFGRADLFARADRIGFPIELKDETSNERLSGQIFKYIKGAIRLIKHGNFDTVQGVTIAPGYSQEAVNQLKAYGVWVFRIEMKEDRYTLTRID